jgi:hypothetical protein
MTTHRATAHHLYRPEIPLLLHGRIRIDSSGYAEDIVVAVADTAAAAAASCPYPSAAEAGQASRRSKLVQASQLEEEERQD